MPTSFSALVFFVALIVPGMININRIAVRHALEPVTVLRETASIVTISLLSDLIAALLVGSFAALSQSRSPDVGKLISGTDYARQNWQRVGGWTLGTLLLACCIAANLGIPSRPVRWCVRLVRLERLGRKRRVGHVGPIPDNGRITAWLERAESQPIWQKSSWVLATTAPHGHYVQITVVLTDGCVVRGVRMSINPQITEDGNRDMVLYPPIFRKRPDESELTRTKQDVVVISASRSATSLRGCGQFKTLTRRTTQPTPEKRPDETFRFGDDGSDRPRTTESPHLARGHRRACGTARYSPTPLRSTEGLNDNQSRVMRVTITQFNGWAFRARRLRAHGRKSTEVGDSPNCRPPTGGTI